MTKYIIEYLAGTKGDLLVRFLNNHSSNIGKENFNRTDPVEIGIPNWMKITNMKDQSPEKYKNVLLKNNYKFIGAHEQRNTFGTNEEYNNLLKEFDYKIIKIIFDEKYYRTVVLESISKNFVTLNENETDYHVKKNNLLTIYNRNEELIKNKINLDYGEHLLEYKNRIKLFRLLVENIDKTNIYKRFSNFNKNQMKDKLLLDYQDLFIKNDLSKYSLFDGYDHQLFKDLVEKSWCPDILEIEDLKINLKDFGYRVY